MFCYKLLIESQSVDYYTDEYTYHPEIVHTFSDNSIWIARLHLRLFLIKLQRDTTIVYFHRISITLFYAEHAESVNLGTWYTRYVSKGQNAFGWNWDAEAAIIEKYHLYREADKDLLTIEKLHYQAISPDEVSAKNTSLLQQLAHFEKKYALVLNTYAPEMGILYFFLDDRVKAFEWLLINPMPCLQHLTYNIAFYLSYIAQEKDNKYLKKFREFYDAPPFLSYY